MAKHPEQEVRNGRNSLWTTLGVIQLGHVIVGNDLPSTPLFLLLGDTRDTGKTPIRPAAPTPSTRGRSKPPTYTIKERMPNRDAVATAGALILVRVK